MSSPETPYWRTVAAKVLGRYQTGVDEDQNPLYENVPPELKRAIDTFWELADTEPRVRSNIIASATIMFAGLNEHPLNKVYGSPGVLRPEMIYDGAIICINLPLHMGPAAKVAFVLWKLAVQKMLLMRAPTR